MRIVLRPVAFAELDEARTRYDEKRAGLGEEFVREADQALRHIREAPTSFPQVHGAIRRLLMRRFPSGIFYRDSDTEIVILGITHLRRDPRRWQGRG